MFYCVLKIQWTAMYVILLFRSWMVQTGFPSCAASAQGREHMEPAWKTASAQWQWGRAGRAGSFGLTNQYQGRLGQVHWIVFVGSGRAGGRLVNCAVGWVWGGFAPTSRRTPLYHCLNLPVGRCLSLWFFRRKISAMDLKPKKRNKLCTAKTKMALCCYICISFHASMLLSNLLV